MVRRPLWNRSDGVFVEEASWSVPLDRRAAADLPAAPGEAAAAPSVRTVPAADRERPRGALPPASPPKARRRAAGRRSDERRGVAPRTGPPWIGVPTVDEG